LLGGSQAEASQPRSGGGEGAAAQTNLWGVALTLHDNYKNPVRWEVRSEPIKVRSDKLWERLSGEADGKALPQNYLLVSCYHNGSALTRSIERSASQSTSLT